MPTCVDPEQVRWLRGLRTACMLHLPQRPDEVRRGPRQGVEQGHRPGLQPGARPLLGVLLLREDLPAVAHRDARLLRRDAAGRDLTRCAARVDHVDGQYRDKRVKRFKFPIRTTPWGTIDPFRTARVPPSLASRTRTSAAKTWLGGRSLFR